MRILVAEPDAKRDRTINRLAKSEENFAHIGMDIRMHRNLALFLKLTAMSTDPIDTNRDRGE